MSEKGTATWRSHVPSLFEEIINNNEEMWALKQPLVLTLKIMAVAAQEAAARQDYIMMEHFCRLTLYEDVDPYVVGAKKAQENLAAIEKAAQEQRESEKTSQNRLDEDFPGAGNTELRQLLREKGYGT